MTRFILTTLTMIVMGPAAFAAEPADPKDKNDDVARKVWQNVLAHVNEVSGYNQDAFFNTCWAPQLLIVDAIDFGGRKDDFNACAVHLRTKLFGRYLPVVMITRKYIAASDANPNVLAMTFGHELGHHILGHTRKPWVRTSGVVYNAETRQQEADADLFGAKVVLRTPQYSLRTALLAKWRAMDRAGGLYSEAGAGCIDHPGWSERLARIMKKLDQADAELWTCMSTFENGVTFLAEKDFVAAETCFERVLKEFPTCHEAWANLGLARLLRYMDGLVPEDVEQLGLGHFLGTIYYPSARSLTRSDPAELWEKALVALKRANELKPGSPVILANLGLAYMLHPGGKDKGIGDAYKCFASALENVDKLKEFPLRVRLTLKLNLGVAAIGMGQRNEGQELLAAVADKVEGVLQAIKAWKEENLKKGNMVEDSDESWLLEMQAVLDYNRGLRLADKDPKAAVKAFESFLESAPSSDLWWSAGYEQYAEACRAAGVQAKPKTKLTQATAHRKRLGVMLPSGDLLFVGQGTDELARLGAPDRVTPVPNTGLRKLEFKKLGLYVVASDDEVVLIVITSANGPRVVVQDPSLGGKVVGEIRVGMGRTAVQALPGGRTCEKRPIFAKPGSGNVDLNYYDYYADLGVAVAYTQQTDEGVVAGVIIGPLAESR